MRKTLLLLASMALAVLLGAGVALAGRVSGVPDMATYKVVWIQRARTLALWFLALLVATSISVLLVVKDAHAASFVVNRTGDARDANLANTRCDVSASQQGNQCSLRAAIQEANDTTRADVISFNIPGDPNVPGLEVKTISPTRPLPTIREAVTINGYSQPGASPNTLAHGSDAVLNLQLNGTNAGTEADGLRITAGDLVAPVSITGLVINRFQGNGIRIEGSGISGIRIDIHGNFIGTNANGTTNLGNARHGVAIVGVSRFRVGGPTSDLRNVISGNGGNGIYIEGGDGFTRDVRGNFIGTNANGTADLGNAKNGVRLFDTFDTSVGGATPKEANRIAYNGAAGVSVGGSSASNIIVRNSIFSNGALGIDLNSADVNDGVTPNDTEDTDTGANNLQNYPVITSAVRNTVTGQTVISGTLNSTPNQDFFIWCYVAEPDPSGFGEGKIMRVRDGLMTDPDGNATFSCVSTVPQVGQSVTANANSLSTGDTSEFSQNVQVTSSS